MSTRRKPARAKRPSEPSRPPKPAPPPDAGSLLHPLTFFLTSDQRTAVLRTLRKRSRHRASALLTVLKLPHD